MQPLPVGSRKKYCSGKCRQSAYRWRQAGAHEPVYGNGELRSVSAEDAAAYLAEIKAAAARMAALRGRGDAFGDACAAIGKIVEDDLRELGL